MTTVALFAMSPAWHRAYDLKVARTYLPFRTCEAFAFGAFFAACKRSFLIRRAFRFLTLSEEIGMWANYPASWMNASN